MRKPISSENKEKSENRKDETTKKYRDSKRKNQDKTKYEDEIYSDLYESRSVSKSKSLPRDYSKDLGLNENNLNEINQKIVANNNNNVINNLPFNSETAIKVEESFINGQVEENIMNAANFNKANIRKFIFYYFYIIYFIYLI